MNTVDPIVTRLSEVIGKIVIDSDVLDENADFGHFSLFLACFWPVKCPKLSMDIFDLVLTGFNEIGKKN